MDYKDMERARRASGMRMSHAERLRACEALSQASFSMMPPAAQKEWGRTQRLRRVYKEENGRLSYAGAGKWIESVCAIPPEERR